MSEDAALLKTYIDPEQMKLDINIDIADLNTGMQRQASKYAYYATQTVYAKSQYERFKAALEILEAKLDGLHRQALKEENPKTTESQIKAAVLTDTRYKNMAKQVIRAQEIYRLCEVAERAFDHRRDMILQMARDASKEREGALRVAANTTNRDRIMDAMARNAEAASVAS
jgi:hypothetical protein